MLIMPLSRLPIAYRHPAPRKDPWQLELAVLEVQMASNTPLRELAVLALEALQRMQA